MSVSREIYDLVMTIIYLFLIGHYLHLAMRLHLNDESVN
jgi:hypothetical protein